MNINDVFKYLTEELEDIPARPDNIHYTNIPALVKILKSRILKPQSYVTSLNKNKKEIATARSTTTNIKDSLSEFTDNVKISLFTKRILAGVHGIKKTPIAELPIERENSLKHQENILNGLLQGNPIPNLQIKYFEDWEPVKSNLSSNYDNKGEILVKDWMNDNLNFRTANEFKIVKVKLCRYFKDKYLYKKELETREGEERFATKTGIPVDPKFMKINIIGKPSKEFWEEVYNVDTIGDDEESEEIYKRCKEAYSVLQKGVSDNIIIPNSNFNKLMDELKVFTQRAKSKIKNPV